MTAPNALASFPDTDVNIHYRMGPQFTSTTDDFVWNAVLDDGTYTACAEPVGWESVDYITPVDQVGGRDGGLTGPQSVAPRVLECSALITCPTPQIMRHHLARLRKILGPQGLPGPRQPIIWEQYDWWLGYRLALITRPQGRFEPRIIPGFQNGALAAQIRFQLVAANPPWKYRSGLPEGGPSGGGCTGLPNPALLGGRTYDKTFSYTYGFATNPGGEMLLVNSGDLPAFPVFTITGPVDQPVITNITSGAEFTVNKTLAAGEVLTIDAKTGVITPSTVRLTGRPWLLAPGSNTVRWRSTSGSFDPAAQLCLAWRSTSS